MDRKAGAVIRHLGTLREEAVAMDGHGHVAVEVPASVSRAPPARRPILRGGPSTCCLARRRPKSTASRPRAGLPITEGQRLQKDLVVAGVDKPGADRPAASGQQLGVGFSVLARAVIVGHAGVASMFWIHWGRCPTMTIRPRSGKLATRDRRLIRSSQSSRYLLKSLRK